MGEFLASFWILFVFIGLPIAGIDMINKIK